jgi:hypothetical protein
MSAGAAEGKGHLPATGVDWAVVDAGPDPRPEPAATASAPSSSAPGNDDSWEPGPPSLRAMAPSVIGGAVVPLAVYTFVRHRVDSDTTALVIAGIPAAAFVAVEWIRKRRLDPVGGIVLFGFVAGLVVSAALGGSAFVLKVRDSAFTTLFALACLASLWVLPRPLMFYVGRVMSAGDDPVRIRAYDDLWEIAAARRAFAIITITWGIGLLCEAAVRVILAMTLTTGQLLAIGPFVSTAFIAGLFGFTVWYSRLVRGRAEPTA